MNRPTIRRMCVVCLEHVQIWTEETPGVMSTAVLLTILLSRKRQDRCLFISHHDIRVVIAWCCILTIKHHEFWCLILYRANGYYFILYTTWLVQFCITWWQDRLITNTHVFFSFFRMSFPATWCLLAVAVIALSSFPFTSGCSCLSQNVHLQDLYCNAKYGKLNFTIFSLLRNIYRHIKV